MKPFTFSNGVTIPKGTIVVLPLMGVHYDESVYENPNEFDGFRFSRKLEHDGENAKYHATNTSEEYLQFGNGPHAWFVRCCYVANASPGRFFAINEIKLMLAFTLLRFDIKTKDGIRPPDFKFQSNNIPNRSAEILYRKRR
jgi:cytochrome P450